MSRFVTAVIVTYNRKELLQRCLTAMTSQSRRPDHILIVDNASTDGTREWLAKAGWLDTPGVELLALPENTGGAGGFSAGIGHAIEGGADWAWIMDDDAIPYTDALERLLETELSGQNLYGSAACMGDRLSWPMRANSSVSRDMTCALSELAPQTDVRFIPFLGLLIGKELVERIGLPDPGFFIAADDVDYCMRARSAGARIILVANSLVEHPTSEPYALKLPGGRFYCLRLVPWKRYYDVRNRIFVARNHYGLALYYKTIPGSFLRLIGALIHEDNRPGQLKAFAAGMIDGLLGRKGRRHEHWGL